MCKMKETNKVIVVEAVDREGMDLEEMERLLKIREAEDDYNAVLDALKTVVPLATKYPQTAVAPTEIAKPLLTLARAINRWKMD